MTNKELEYFNLAFDKAKKKNKNKAKICWFCLFAAFVAICLLRLHFNV